MSVSWTVAQLVAHNECAGMLVEVGCWLFVVCVVCVCVFLSFWSVVNRCWRASIIMKKAAEIISVRV